MTPSVANFLLVRFPGRRRTDGAGGRRFLVRRGLVLRAVGAYGLPDCLRLTVGTEEANRLVVAALADFVAGDKDGARA